MIEALKFIKDTIDRELTISKSQEKKLDDKEKEEDYREYRRRKSLKNKMNLADKEWFLSNDDNLIKNFYEFNLDKGDKR